jgi:HEAT repeat protein
MSALILAISLAAQGQEEPKPTVEELIKNLGSEEFKVREEAQKKLELMGNEIVPQLKEAQEKT